MNWPWPPLLPHPARNLSCEEQASVRSEWDEEDRKGWNGNLAGDQGPGAPLWDCLCIRLQVHHGGCLVSPRKVTREAVLTFERVVTLVSTLYVEASLRPRDDSLQTLGR